MNAQLQPSAARNYGQTVYSVRSFAAIGDGVHDDTRAFQCAIDALPADGGTVTVPAGTYLIDPVISVNLRSNVCLDLGDAVLIAKPNAEERYNILLIRDVSDVEVIGGTLIGDRLHHDHTAGGTHEWGHGIRVGRSQRVTILGTVIRECTGDGLSVSGEDIEMRGVLSTHNRRQGLTIAVGTGYRILNCEFAFTGDMPGSLGNSPRAGIDIEPDSGLVEDVLIEGCNLHDNQSAGLLAMVRIGTDAVNRNITIRNCAVYRNHNGIEVLRSSDVLIEGCVITDQRWHGVRLGPLNVGVAIRGNTFGGNLTRGTRTVPPRDPPFDQVGVTAKTSKDVNIEPGVVADVGNNRYV